MISDSGWKERKGKQWETCGSIEDPRFFTGNGRLLLRTLRILSIFLNDFVKDWGSPNDEASDVVAEGHF